MLGIATALSLRSSVAMRQTLHQIQTGQVWIGVLGGPDPLNSPGIMLVMSEGNVQNKVFVVRQIPQGHEFLRSASIPAEAGGYNVQLVIDNGSVTFTIDSMPTPAYPLSFADRQLFIGYRNQFGYNAINAQISNLKYFGKLIEQQPPDNYQAVVVHKFKHLRNWEVEKFMSKNAKSPVITAASITATGMIFAAVINLILRSLTVTFVIGSSVIFLRSLLQP